MARTLQRFRLVRFLLVPCLALICFQAHAQDMKIVAFGTSLTAGHYVSSEETFPSKLEALLRADGEKVRIQREGYNGDTTRKMLLRMDSSVPEGTSVVIFEAQINNDGPAGIQSLELFDNKKKMILHWRARKIQVLHMSNCARDSTFPLCVAGKAIWDELDKNAGTITVYIPISRDMIGQADHLSPAGHSQIAAALEAPVRLLIARARAGGG